MQLPSIQGSNLVTKPTVQPSVDRVRGREEVDLFLSERISVDDYRNLAEQGVILAIRNGACCYVFRDKDCASQLQVVNDRLKADGVLSEFMGAERHVRTFVDQATFALLRDRLQKHVAVPVETGKGVSGVRGASSGGTRLPLFEKFVEIAKEAKASDIQFVEREIDCLVRMRVDGDYETIETISAEEGAAVIAAVMMKSESDIRQFKKTEPQGGGYDSKSGVTLRLNTYPNRDGVSMSGRLLGGSHGAAPTSLEGLGYLPSQLRTLRHAIAQPTGIILFTGITGSGKSTSMCGALYEAAGDVELERITKNILTAEHPVEYPLPIAIQAPVHEHIPERGWGMMLRAQLRNDPDIILIGEIRDQEVAHTAVNSAMTGHLVFSTLHTNNIPAIFERLVGLRVDRSLLLMPGLFNCMISQTLVKKFCPRCAVDANSKAAVKLYGSSRVNDIDEFFGDLEGIKFHDPNGCPHCHKGRKGQDLVAEVLYVDKIIRDGIRESNMDSALAKARENGWKDRFDVAKIKIKEGKLCPFHVEEAVGHLTSGNEIYQYRDS